MKWCPNYSHYILFPLCTAMKCPVHSHYEICANSCPATCRNLAPPEDCDAICQEDCSCDEGYILSGDRCVPFSQCGCVYNNGYYRVGQVFHPNGKCQEECKCTQDGKVIESKVDNFILISEKPALWTSMSFIFGFDWFLLFVMYFLRLSAKKSNVAHMRSVN